MGRVVYFNIRSASEFKIPHMGWNYTRQVKESRLFKEMYPDPRFYFVHSYHVSAGDDSDILTTTEYENEFVSSFERVNIAGVQFHPEKSHRYGMLLLKNFAELY
jgi:glutamine amidotransferase